MTGKIVKTKSGEHRYRIGEFMLPFDLDAAKVKQQRGDQFLLPACDYAELEKRSIQELRIGVEALGLPLTLAVEQRYLVAQLYYDIESGLSRLLEGSVPESKQRRMESARESYRALVSRLAGGDRATILPPATDGTFGVYVYPEKAVKEGDVQSSHQSRQRAVKELPPHREGDVVGVCPLEPGTALATLWAQMRDGAPKKIDELQKLISAKVTDRLRMLRRRGEEAGLWTVKVEGNMAQMLPLAK